MSYRDIIIGLEIFERHDKFPGVAAEHDLLYAGDVDPKHLTTTERDALKKAGWSWDASLPSWVKNV